MKRVLVASILGLAATAIGTYGQGNIIFSNYISSNTTQVRWGYFSPPGYNHFDPVTDPSVIINLYAGAGTLTDSSLLTTFLGTAAIFATPDYGGGWYDGGAVQIPTTVWSGPGATVTFQVRATYGHNPFVIGDSALWQESTAIVSISLPPDPFANGPMPLIIVPEPSTTALAGLGAAAMLVFRKRK
jgi:hypothetical protein